MPMYPYRCEECNYEEDFLYSMSDELPKVKTCTKCKKRKMIRNYTSTPVHYSTEFKEENKINYDKSPSGRKHFY
jgi:putative FmdB family regulatory protein